MSNSTDPIIIIGMHRSGTSMITRILKQLGLFVGWKTDINCEAIFFRWLNTWLMGQCGARWDMPAATHYLWENEELLTWIDDYIRFLLDSPRAIQYLGLRRFLATGGITRLKNIPWGWKDPRNTFTLLFWLRIFPGAKVIYIERHGVDVAQSLVVRSQKQFISATNKYSRFRLAVFLRPKRSGFIDSPRSATLEGAVSLWKEYVDQARRALQKLSSNRVLKLRYENVLEDPVQYIQSTVEFCGLDISTKQIEDVVVGINNNRAYSYLAEPELRDFAIDHSEELSKRGYQCFMDSGNNTSNTNRSRPC